jgi:hypothetical protein
MKKEYQEMLAFVGVVTDVEEILSKAGERAGCGNIRLYKVLATGRYFLEMRHDGRVHTWSAGSLAKLRSRVSKGMRHAF